VQFSYCLLSVIGGKTGLCHHSQHFSFEMESYEHFCLSWPETAIFPISAPCVAGMTDLHHDVQSLVETSLINILPTGASN
jgi:hypothetical protein